MITKDAINLLKSDEDTLLDEIISSDLVMFGEDHNVNSGRVWLKNLIPQVSSNFQSVGLEYIPSPDAQYLNDQDLLVKHLAESYKDFPGFDSNSIIGITNVCRANDLKIFGIDMPPDYFDDWQDQENQKERVDFMAKNVLRQLATGKALTLFGGDHIENRRDNVYGVIKKDKPETKILSVAFVGGKSWSIDTEDYWLRKLELAATELNMPDKFFVLKNSDNILPCDVVIHFPQVEKL